jgi:hypothetical protein
MTASALPIQLIRIMHGRSCSISILVVLFQIRLILSSWPKSLQERGPSKTLLQSANHRNIMDIPQDYYCATPDAAFIQKQI